MLEGRGIDFESIGFAMGVRRQVDALYADANAEIEKANAVITREVAQLAGRTAQLTVLLDALREVDPGHPALQPTGLFLDSGQPELGYMVAWDDAYDAVARTRGIPLCRRAMSPRDQAYDAVMREPVEESRFLFSRRWHWRGDEYRSRAGAERARARAAAAAREAA